MLEFSNLCLSTVLIMLQIYRQSSNLAVQDGAIFVIAETDVGILSTVHPVTCCSWVSVELSRCMATSLRRSVASADV